MLHSLISRRSAFFVSQWKSPLIGLGALLLCLVALQFLWVKPTRAIADVKIGSEKTQLTQKEVFELMNSIRQTCVQAVGGVALLLGLYFTAKTLRTSQETLRVTQEGQITERFTKAIEHLGDKERLTVRLGGIYALERIARDSAKDHWQIMEVLTAYIRDNAPWPPKDTKRPPKPATDIQAILTVVGRRNYTPDREKGEPLELFETDLHGALLTGNLDKALFSSAHLESAWFLDTHLEGASFINAYLPNASLQQACLKGAKLAGATLDRADLTGADLREADLTATSLQRATLAGAFLERADLSFAHLEGADLKGADLRGADFDRTHLDGAILTDACLEGAKNLTDTQLATKWSPAKHSELVVIDDQPDPSL